ncbi:MAG TPA: hypothetical protein PKJ47_02915 [Candidatus Limiplasma sp.]|nr:hypothetical protein [Candidatus Limiplasma sp.]
MKKRLLAILTILVCLFAWTSASAGGLRDILAKRNLLTTNIIDFWKNSDDEYYSTRYKTKGNDMLINVRFTNSSEDETVDAIDVAIYCTNAYDENMTPDDDEDGYIRYFTADTKIKPGKSAYIGYCRMKGCKAAKEYHIALVRYHIKDGSTKEVAKSSLTTDALSKYTWITWDLRK